MNTTTPRVALVAADLSLRHGTSPQAGQTAMPVACSLLFIGNEAADESDTAAREAAVELAGRLDRPVLLLDAGLRPNTHWTQLAAMDRLLDRPPWCAQPGSAPSGQPALYFHPVAGDGRLFVSRLSPAALSADEAFWREQAARWPRTQLRLLDLFATIVLVGPPLVASGRMLGFARVADATVLVLRAGHQSALRATRLRQAVLAAGGRAAGLVLTGCADALDDPDRGRMRW